MLTTLNLSTSINPLVSILYASIAVLAVGQRKSRQPAIPALILYVLVSFLWTAGQAAGQRGWLSFLAGGFLARIPLYGLVILGIFFLLLSRAFLQRGGGVWWWLLAIAWTAGLVLLDLNPLHWPEVLWSGYGWYIARAAAVPATLVTGWAVFVGSAVFLIWQAYHRAEPPLYRNPLSYWTMVVILTVAGGVLFFAGYQTTGSVFHLLGTLLAAYVILTIRLPDIRRLARRILSFLVVTGLAVVLYTAVFAAVYTFFQPLLSAQPVLVGLFLAAILAVLFNTFLRAAQKQIDRLLPWRNQDPARILRRYSQSITNILDLQLLATVAVETVNEILEVRHGFLFLVDFEKGQDGTNCYCLRGVKGMGETNPDPIELPEDSLLAGYLSQEHRPLSQSEIDEQPRFETISEQERAWLASLGAEVYVPIYSKDEWIGLLALGPKFTGVSYWDEDLDLLSMVADQTAVALENVHLVEGLMRLNNDFRRANLALDVANRNLERLDRTKSDFISIASHELRTPLTVISGSSQMLAEDPGIQGNPYYRQMITKILSGTGRLHEIVDSLLDIAKIDASDLKLELLPVSLNALIEGIAEELGEAFQERKQTFLTENLVGLPHVEADRDALRKVFYHLIINAVKYTPDGGIITVSGRTLQPTVKELPKGGVEIIVSDTGIGIDERFKELIFTKFYQNGELALHSSGKTKFKGSGPGLGLAITRGIVEAHRGKVWVESPGYNEETCPGSQFHVILPLEQPAKGKNPLLAI